MSRVYNLMQLACSFFLAVSLILVLGLAFALNFTIDCKTVVQYAFQTFGRFELHWE